MVNRMGMQHTLEIFAFWAEFYFNTMVEKDVMNQEITNTIHSDPNPEKQPDIQATKKAGED